MLRKFYGTLVALSVATLVGFGCDSSPAASGGTGGAIGAGTGGAAMGGAGGTAMGTGGDSSGTGGDSGETGGAGGSVMGTGGSAAGTSESNLAILNAEPPAGVQALDPSIGGTPKTYSNGTCQ